MLEVVERGAVLRFSFEDVLRFHGGHSPGGAAIAYQVLARALPELGACERRAIVDELARPGRGRVLERFAWRLSGGGRTVELVLREGFADEEFIDLARTPERDAAQEARLTELKRALAERVMARRPDQVIAISPR